MDERGCAEPTVDGPVGQALLGDNHVDVVGFEA